MVARVQVLIEAKDATSGVFRAITSEMGAFGGLVEELTAKNISWGNVGQQAAQMVINGVKDAINVTAEYAKDVRDLSLASGQSAEASSRMLQVLDDYQLSAEDAATATRALTKEGLAPTIETVAQLSGEYLKLTSAEERNAFIMKNLGRAGKEWMNLLAQGPDAIMAMNEAVADGLILTEENVAAYEEYRLALDAWGDTMMEAKVKIGTALLPAMTGVVDEVNNTTAAIKIMQDQGYSWLEILGEMAINSDVYTNALIQAAAGTTELSETQVTATQTATELAEAEKAAAEAFREDLGELQEILKGDLGAAQDEYNGKVAEYIRLLGEAKTQKEKDEINANIAAETEEYNKRAAAIMFNIQQEAILNSQIDKTVQIEMITALGQAYGIYDEATANSINTAQGWVSQVEAGNMSAETAILYLRGMAKGIEQTAETAGTASAPVDLFNSNVYHAGERAKDAAEAFGGLGRAASELGEAVSKDAVGPVGALKSGLKQLPPDGSAWNYYFNIHTRGSIPKFSSEGTRMCFVAGTLITLSDGTRKPIEQIQEGDEVRSYNLDRREFTAGTVSNTMTRRVTEYLNIDGICVTPEHPFWIIGRDDWVKAGEIERGDILLRDFGGMKVVTHIFKVSLEVDVYNLTVEGEHNYFAGGVLVHNKEAEDSGNWRGDALPGNAQADMPFFAAGSARADAMAAMQNAGMNVTLYSYGTITVSADSETGGDIMSIR